MKKPEQQIVPKNVILLAGIKDIKEYGKEPPTYYVLKSKPPSKDRIIL
jgi:hypothetical protein